jgi:hypothetical protein
MYAGQEKRGKTDPRAGDSAGESILRNKKWLRKTL